MNVFGVVDNYEVLGVYDNIDAARAHASNYSDTRVQTWAVSSQYPYDPVEPAETQPHTVPVESVRRLEINPGERLVVSILSDVDEAAFEQAVELLKDAWPGCEVLVTNLALGLQVVADKRGEGDA